MKKCPTCGKTFDDNLKFCQTDGTALVEDAPPPDPYQTIVVRPEDIGAAIPLEPITPSTKAENIHEDVLEIPDDNDDFGSFKGDDPMKTMVSTDSPFDLDDDMMKTAVVSEAERKELFGEKSEFSAPPSPFGGSSADNTSDAPPPPKFSEPDLSSPSFGDIGSSSPKPPPPISPPSSPPPPTFEPPRSPSVPPNTPIPSPFDESMPPGYQTPSTPPFKEPEAQFNDVSSPFGGSSFNDPNPVGQNMQQSDWTPPAPDMPSQPYNQSPADGGGKNQTLAIVSLILGVLGFVCLGFIGGIGAIITGFMARKNATENPNEYGGAGLALAGIILGAIATLANIAIIIFVLLAGNLKF